MKRRALIPLAALVFAACQDATQPVVDTQVPLLQVSAGANVTATDLGTLGGMTSRGLFINELGQVAGLSRTAGNKLHAFFWDGSITDIGTLGSEVIFTAARSMNDLGAVVGISPTAVDKSSDPRGDFHAFLWTQQDGIKDLGTLSTAVPFPTSDANDINNVGQVVGRSIVPSGAGGPREGERRAFLWTQLGGMIDLGTLGGPTSSALSINDLGQVVGISTPNFADRNLNHAFLWTQQGGMIDLGTLGRTSSPSTLNDVGQVVGGSVTLTGQSHAFLWTQQDGMIDLGTLGGNFSRGRSINNRGHVVGQARTTSGERHAFLWTQQDGMIDLGTLGGTFSAATAINGLGQVVGSSSIAGDLVEHAFLWQHGTMTDLGTAVGFVHSDANGINDLGQVVGTSHDDVGVERHATIWTTLSGQQQPIAATIPELQEIVDNNPDTPLAAKLNNAIANLITALQELNKTPPDNQAAVGNIEGAVGDLEAAVTDGLLDAVQGAQLMDPLAGIARQLAVNALNEAIDREGGATAIADAQQFLADGDALRTSGAFKDAVNKYKDVLAKAESA